MLTIQGVLTRLGSVLASVRRGFGRIAQAMLGEIAWKAPPWVSWVGGRAWAGVGAAVDHVKSKPRQSATVAASALVLLMGLYIGWRWYESRPKPVETAFTVTAPDLTCYACDPPGKPNPLVVHFSNSTAPLAQAGKDVDPASTAIRMAPALKGTWHWDDDRTLRFQPTEDWPIGAKLEVRLPRTGFTAAHVRLKEYELELESPRFEARLADTQFHQDPVVARDKKVVASIAFTHPVDPKRFEKRVSLEMFEQVTDTMEEKRGTVPFTVVYDKLRLNAHIHSAQLDVPNKTGRVAIRVDSGLRAARGGNETREPIQASMRIPGLYSLDVQHLGLAVVRDERDEPSQALMLQLNHSVIERDVPAGLHAWLLPERHPDPNVQRRYVGDANRPFPWSATTATPAVLAASETLPLTHVLGELEHYEMHSFRHEAEPGRYLYIKVDKGLKSFGGYVLGRSVENVLQVPEYPQELRIAQQGSLLALSGDKTLTVMTRDVPAMRVQIGRLLPRQIQHLVSQTDGSFTQPGFRNWTFDAADITERFAETIRLPRLKPGAAHYQPVQLAKYLAEDAGDRRGIFFVRVQAWDAENDRPVSGSVDSSWNESRGQGMTDARLVVVTDLGMLVKKSLDGSQDVFVQSIRSGDPLAEVRVEVLGRNGLPMLSGTTDGEGHVHFADLRSFKNEQKPVLYLARRAGDTSFLPIEDRDRGLDLSRFDVGGVDNTVDQGTLSAYLFSDRGLYRPGEEIRLGAIVRSQDWSRSLQGVPLRLDIVDPRGTSVRSEAFMPGAAGFADIRHATRPSSPAGTYTVSISIVRPQGGTDLIGSTTVQVRDFLPDRLRMSTHFSAENAEGWVPPEDLTALVSVQNLFGTPAANRRVTARMTLTPAFPAFKGYPDYRFHDPQAAQQGFDESLTPTTTNEKGEATFDLNLKRFARATYRLHLATEGFEADGGRGVSSEAAQLVSNMPYLVGWKPDGDLNYVSRDSRRSVQLIAIDPRAAKTEVKGLKLTRLETKYISTLIRQNNGTYQYESRRKEVALDERALALPRDGMTLALATDSPGSFVYVVADAEGQRLARIEYHVAGNANLTRTLEKDAQLQITLARPDYAAGDEIEMQIQAPYTGAGLITIERDRVYAWRWFHTSTTSSTQKIRLPAGIEGNAYVHVAFVRDPSSDEIYTSPLSYGVQPFSINMDGRRNAIRLDVPALIKPGETLKLGYSTAKPARIVVFAVDEGILQVAAYRAPDPLAHFFQKRSLNVSTTQILDLILPEFRRGGLAAPGGDGEAALGRHLNPFRRKGEKPVAWWSGVLDSDSTLRTLEYEVPDYFNGKLRVMAVAVSDDAVGVQQRESLVRGEFVLSPNAPTTVTPGDEFEVSVGVANNLAGSGPDAQVAVTLKPGPALKLLGPAEQKLAIAENREGSARFRLQVLDRLGSADIEFTAGVGASRVRRRTDLSVRPATPYMTVLSAGTFKRGNKEVPIGRNLYPEYRTLESSVSLVPLSLAHGFVSYLAHYPYACTEQIVSQAVPALMLSERPEFGYVRAQPGASIEDLINELRVRQNDEGAYKLWPGGNDVVEFASLYAQHFLIEASARGQRVPVGLVDSGNRYLQALSRRDGNNLTEERNTAYAIYLLMRQGRVMSGEVMALQKRLTERYKGQWEQDLATAWLAASFRLMRQERDAKSLIDRLRFGVDASSERYYDAMTRDGFLLYVMSRHFPERLPDLPAQVLESLAARINGSSYHSLSAGTTLLALDAYVTATRADQPQGLGIAEVLRDTKAVRPIVLPEGMMPKVNFTASARALRFSSGTDLNAFYLVNESGFDRTPPKESITRGFEILREYTTASGQPLSQATVGEQIDVHLKFRATEDRGVTSVALVDLLPGGFDLVIPPQRSPDSFQDESSEAGNTGGDPRCAFCTEAAGSLSYADPREDRVVFYIELNRDVQSIVYRIKATNAGTYTVPPAYGEAMYDRGVVGRSVAGRIEVVKP